MTAAEQYVASSTPMSCCPSCGIYYVGWHTCGPRMGFSQPVYPLPWPMPDTEIDRIARRVVELLSEQGKDGT